MTVSDVERRLTAVLHRQAEDAMNRTDTLTELDTFQRRADGDARARTRRRAGTAAAALTAAAVGVGALWLGAGPDGSPEPAVPAPPATSPSPSETSEAPPDPPQTPGSRVEGFEGFESFPMSFTVPRRFADPSYDLGTRGYTVEGTSGGVGAFLIDTFDGVEASDLPDDLAAHIDRTREDLLVSDVGTTDLAGRTAQTFTLAQKPDTAPYDLFCARSGSCFKLLPDKPMDVTALRTGRGLVLFWVEYLPEDRAEVQGPVQQWFSSLTWE
ncbi:hypothetical protein G7072_15810 [Nocardioides sp. HDW12B]|uniref:hypothetical protein n=1 Tax=Nocardioides sp. HDW12B TaxID=2714939 RepID=UPI00140A868F|nr:hypothetical protein [Nocardioides sp. HDW12B]QIK67622.1 hypothetical protein G7072_15810 [Nocardioides sp. HDW12B]